MFAVHAESGLVLEATVKFDVVSNLSGGLQAGTRSLHNEDLKLTAGTEKLLGWPGTFHLHVLGNSGAHPNHRLVGSFMGVDNIEVARGTMKFFQAWLQRDFDEGRASLRAGLYPIDSEFYVTRSTAIFFHPSAGMAAEVGQTGVAGPSIFPTSSFGVRARWEPTGEWRLQAAVLDGVPGDPRNPHGTHIRFHRGDGTLAIVEGGFRSTDSAASYALGAWRYTPRFDALAEHDASGRPARRVNRGAYVFGERMIHAEPHDPAQGLSIFVRFGVANGAVNVLDRSYSTGFSYRGLIPGRDADECGVLVTRAHAGAAARRSAPSALAAHETVVEATYRAVIAPWLALQPAVQRIVHPGFGTAAGAWVALARVELTF